MSSASTSEAPVCLERGVEMRLERALFFYSGCYRTIAVAFEHKDGEFTDAKCLSSGELLNFLPTQDGIVSGGHDVLPPHVLYHDPEVKVIWWAPGKRRKINIRKSNQKTYAHPPLVFKLEASKLYVAGLPTNQHPTGATNLIKAPYRGIDVHGSTVGMCNVVAPRSEQLKDLPEWENAFFLSKFNFKPSRNKPEQLGMNLEQWI